MFLVCPDDIDHRDCKDMLLNCWPLCNFCPYQKHNDLSMQIRSKTTSPTSQLPHLNGQPSTWIILGFLRVHFSPHLRFPAAYSQSERPLFTKGTATKRDHGGSWFAQQEAMVGEFMWIAGGDGDCSTNFTWSLGILDLPPQCEVKWPIERGCTGLEVQEVSEASLWIFWGSGWWLQSH